MPRKTTVQLLDQLGIPEDTTDVTEPLPVVVFRAGKAYLRFGVTDLRYREVSFFQANDTPASGTFRVIPPVED